MVLKKLKMKRGKEWGRERKSEVRSVMGGKRASGEENLRDRNELLMPLS